MINTEGSFGEPCMKIFEDVYVATAVVHEQLQHLQFKHSPFLQATGAIEIILKCNCFSKSLWKK